MRQVWFDFAWASVWIILVTVCAPLLYKLGKFLLGMAEKSRWSDFEYQLAGWLTWIIGGLILLTIFMTNLYIAIQILINPEWHMIKSVMQLIN